MLQPLLGKLNNMRVVLATSSKQRQDLLKTTQLKFEVCASDFQEDLCKENYTFSEYVEETAARKVEDVVNKLRNDPRGEPDIVIGLDTMISFDGAMFGKPRDANDAFKVLAKLTQKGLPHCVYTGVAIKYKDSIERFTEVTAVYMNYLTDDEINAYIQTGEPQGKAGAYAIQGIGGSFVKRIDGDYSNVVGVPLCKLAKKLKKLIL